jgi:nucleotide-binding universal stress UspA family protein
MRQIVVGVDRSDASAAALRWAVEEARQTTAVLDVVHAYLAPLAYVGTDEDIAKIDPELHATAVGNLARFVAAAGVDLEGLEVTQRLHPGRAADGLLAEARTADLLVIGSRGAGGFEGLLLGSTAEHCARHADCPVVVIPAHTPAVTGRITVGVDGSEAAVRALAWAVPEAERRRADIEVVSVYRAFDAAGPYGGAFMQLASPGSTERFRLEAEEQVTEAIASIETRADLRISSTVLAGHPAKVLVERTASTDLLVLGRRGRHGFPGLLLGSVTRQVLHHARSPVAVVPPS